MKNLHSGGFHNGEFNCKKRKELFHSKYRNHGFETIVCRWGVFLKPHKLNMQCANTVFKARIITYGCKNIRSQRRAPSSTNDL